MNMPRGLHPKTLPQRDGRQAHWAVPLPMADQVEYRDAPMRSLGKGVIGVMVVLAAIIAAVLFFASASKPRSPQLAGTAAAHFHAAGPALEPTPAADREALERAHRGPDEAALDRAMDEVVRQGWGDTAPPPGRADVAMNRAKAGQ